MIKSLERVYGKHRLRHCNHGPCLKFSEFRFTAKNSAGVGQDVYVCSEDCADEVAERLRALGLTVL